MNVRRHDTVFNLAFEFGVSEPTIRRDVLLLSADYPIYCRHGGGGGVHFEDGYSAGRKLLSDKQEELLRRLLPELDGEDTEIMLGILKTFAVPKKGEKRNWK